MRKKHDKTGNILLDLTPILDVIFIMLLIFVSESRITKAESDKIISENAVAKEEYETRNQAMDEYYTFVDVIATYEADTPENRVIYLYGDPDAPEEIVLKGRDVEAGYEELMNDLTFYVESNPGKPVVFALNQNNENMLYRDEQRIKEMFESLKDLSDDVYVK
ncbi:MAG: biopolymer transporter ExbD [Lachnospiraceae bacterium]|nr:biopolymer transporter ExbD [Lachnospiraceae bacterium]